MSEPTRDGQIAALKRELAAYVADGRTYRAAQVRRELARLAGGPETAVPDEPETAEQSARPRRRPRA